MGPEVRDWKAGKRMALIWGSKVSCLEDRKIIKEMKLMVAKREELWGVHTSAAQFHFRQMGKYDTSAVCV